MAGIVLLSGLVNLPRVKEILKKGAAIQTELDEKSERKGNIDDLSDYKNQLKPLIDKTSRKK